MASNTKTPSPTPPATAPAEALQAPLPYRLRRESPDQRRAGFDQIHERPTGDMSQVDASHGAKIGAFLSGRFAAYLDGEILFGEELSRQEHEYEDVRARLEELRPLRARLWAERPLQADAVEQCFVGTTGIRALARLRGVSHTAVRLRLLRGLGQLRRWAEAERARADAQAQDALARAYAAAEAAAPQRRPA